MYTFLPLAILAFVGFHFTHPEGADSGFGIPADSFEGIATLAVAAMVVAMLLLWRCPACKLLLVREFLPSKCPRCGVTFWGADPQVAPTPAHQWAIAAGGVLAHFTGEQLDRLGSICRSRVLREQLERSWGIKDRDSLCMTRSWLLGAGHRQMYETARRVRLEDEGRAHAGLDAPEDPLPIGIAGLDDAGVERREPLSLLSWDLSRLICVARWGFVADYITADEAWAWIGQAAHRLQAEYNSWDELIDAFCEGFYIWGEDLDVDPEFTREMQNAADWLKDSSESPLRSLDWNLDLGGLEA